MQFLCALKLCVCLLTLPIRAQNVASTVTLTVGEVSKHNVDKNCWMIVDGKVYDVSTYISSHPGGSATILSGCGKEATTLFAASHLPGTGTTFLPKYLKGSLVSSGPTVTKLTTAELTKHNTKASCWLEVNTIVYDITSYFGSHPGGDQPLVNACGKEVTSLFDQFHTAVVKGTSLPRYKLGAVGATVSNEALAQVARGDEPSVSVTDEASSPSVDEGSASTTDTDVIDAALDNVKDVLDPTDDGSNAGVVVAVVIAAVVAGLLLLAVVACVILKRKRSKKGVSKHPAPLPPPIGRPGVLPSTVPVVQKTATVVEFNDFDNVPPPTMDPYTDDGFGYSGYPGVGGYDYPVEEGYYGYSSGVVAGPAYY